MSKANKPAPFITVYKPIAGWKAVMYWWNDEDFPGHGFWEPWNTSPFAFATEAEAETFGRTWAEAEGIEFKPRERKALAEKEREAKNG